MEGHQERYSVCCNCVGGGEEGIRTKQLRPVYCNRQSTRQGSTAAKFLLWFNSLIKLKSPQVSKYLFIKVPTGFH